MLPEMCCVAGVPRGSLECAAPAAPGPGAWCQRARLSRGRVAARLSGAGVLGCIWMVWGEAPSVGGHISGHLRKRVERQVRWQPGAWVTSVTCCAVTAGGPACSPWGSLGGLLSHSTLPLQGGRGARLSGTPAPPPPRLPEPSSLLGGSLGPEWQQTPCASRAGRSAPLKIAVGLEEEVFGQ